MSELLPLAIGAALIAVLLVAAFTLFKPVPRLGESGTLIEARVLAHEWAIHGATGTLLLSGAVLAAPLILADHVFVGGALIGVLVSAVASFLSRPPRPQRFEGHWLLGRPFAVSFAVHALGGGLLSLLVPVRTAF